MASNEDIASTSLDRTPVPPHATDAVGDTSPSPVTNEDLMRKLCSNGSEIAKLARSIEETQATILDLQIDNDTLKKELGECKKREDELRDQVSQANL